MDEVKEFHPKPLSVYCTVTTNFKKGAARIATLYIGSARNMSEAHNLIIKDISCACTPEVNGNDKANDLLEERNYSVFKAEWTKMEIKRPSLHIRRK